MATKASKALSIVLSLLLVSSAIALSTRREEEESRRELEQCKQECRQQPHYDQGKCKRCESRCEEKQQEKERGGRGDEDESFNPQRQDPEQCLERCKESCCTHCGQREQCLRQCEQEYEEERRREQGREKGRDGSKQDPKQQLEECRQECREKHQGQQQEKLQCQRRCQQQYEKEEQEHGRETRRDPQERLEECRRDCRQQGGQQQKQEKCEQECQREYKEEQEHQQGRGKEEEEKEEEKTRRNNPFVFQQESFTHPVRSEHGSIRILRNFAQKSKLLLGIANYRIAMLEANPNTFVVPQHFDADCVFYVIRGEGTITLIEGNQDRESHNIKQGDILKVSAVTIVYLINRSNNQKLNIAKILNPVSTPGQFEEFYTVGGPQPESYYRVFSNEILEAALNTRRDQLERLFGQQSKGVIIKASEEQIKEMSHQSSSEHGGHWPFGGESRGPYNLLSKRPTHSNQHGRHYEVDSNDYQPLRDLKIQVSLANITGGSMVAPSFNSKATMIAIVIEGRGYFEMVCPHFSQQQGGQGQWGEQGQGQEKEQEEGQQQQEDKRYQKVRSQVSKNTVFIVLPGHPVAIVADKNQNLEVVCFEVNAESNRRTFVAGKNNVVSKMERQAKELAFGVPSKLVDEVFSGRQQDEMFTRGPQSSQQEREGEEGRRQPLNSILEFAAGF